MAYRKYKRRRNKEQLWAGKVSTTKHYSWLEGEQSRLKAEIQQHQDLIDEYQERLGENNDVQSELKELEKKEEEARTAAHWTRQSKPGFFSILAVSDWQHKLAEQEKIHGATYEKLRAYRDDNFDIEMSQQVRNAKVDIAIRETSLKWVNERLLELKEKNEIEQANLKAKKEREQAKLKAKKEKEQSLRALVARENKKSRRAAKTIKANLLKTERCPYCTKEISGLPHADHIFPIAMGGLSVENNMVHVCADCNMAKSDKTLLEFCELAGLDFTQIVKGLRELGKRV